MSMVKAVVSGLLVSTATFAVAQARPSAYSADLARQSGHAANVRATQAQQDQHAANVAALNGNAGAARAFAHAADVRRIQAHRDHRISKHEHDVSQIQRANNN